MEALKSRPELLGVAAEEVVGLGMCSRRGRRLCRRTRPSSRAIGVFFVKSCRACKQAKERENAWVWWDGCRVSKVIPAYLIKCLTWQPAIGGANPSHLPLRHLVQTLRQIEQVWVVWLIKSIYPSHPTREKASALVSREI